MDAKDLFGLSFVGLLVTCLASPAAAQKITGFQTPSNVIEIPSSPIPRSGDAITCYVYDDVMIRVSGTDSPAPDDALILRQPNEGTDTPAKCGRSKPFGIELTSGGSDFVGRLRDFLVFEFADPTGASSFTIFNVKNGHQLFQDGELGEDGYLGLYGITGINESQGILHIRYLRGINASCSLLSDRYGCWSHLLSNRQIPPGAFSGPPSLETCKKSYDSDAVDQRSPNPDDDPSILSYEVALTLDLNGNANVRLLGSLRCDPQP